MNAISKVSDIIYADVADYCRIDKIDQSDINTLNNLIIIAKNYIAGYTGRTIEDLDDYPDISIVVLILCQDMWDNRTMYVDSSNLNTTVDSILHMHSVNLL